MANENIHYELSAADRAALSKYKWRASGATSSESYLKSLCEKSFLRFWTYAGVYRKQADGIAKEVCDVLTVFDQDLIIFSDKDCSWPTSKDQKVNWLRWEKKAISKSMSQLRGAQRLLERQTSSLFLDEQCTLPFPYSLPPVISQHTHLVAVARGAAEECRDFFKGGLGTFFIGCDPENHSSQPFTLIAQPNSQPFVHIFDEIALEVVFSALTTVKDFVAYLNARRDLLTHGNVVVAHGEEDLLALYFAGDSPSPWEGSFPPVPDSSFVVNVPDGLWNSMQPFFEERSQIERIGMLWDGITDHLIDMTITGQLYLAFPPTIEGQERIIRFLARESRGRRIFLAQQLYGLIRGTPKDQRAFRTISTTAEGESTFVFMVASRPPDIPEEVYRTARMKMLTGYCQIIKLKYEFIKEVVGIATEPEDPDAQSLDVVALDLTNWTKEDAVAAEEFRHRTGFMEETKEWEPSDTEIQSLGTDNIVFPGPKAKPYKPKIDRE
ncbi:MAG TPA: hypothetical protein VFE38_00105 [Edaphobacter sp.]|nr:hypothetical protein [Edaphobacter sp.]